MTATPAQLWAALEGVVDPELGMSIVELGLIYGMEIHDGFVRITMTLTTTGCPLHNSMTDWVRTVVQCVPGVRDVDVQLTFDPPWNPERIRPAPFAR